MIKWFKDTSIDDVPLVGGKTASLGEMYRSLTPKGINIPNGFGITADAYWLFVRENGLECVISSAFADMSNSSSITLQDTGRKIRSAFLQAAIPGSLKKDIVDAYQKMGNGDVAVRSSATAEDLRNASFAGQQESFLHISGQDSLLLTCKQCFASLFTDRAISYRIHKGFDHMKVALSICIQQMVRSDLATSGVMFSIDTESGFDNVVLINAAYGLGENIVQGSVNPDEFYVFKPNLSQYTPILRHRLGRKEMKMIYDSDSDKSVKNIPVTESEQNRFAIDDAIIVQLAKWACTIEQHYSAIHGKQTPMDIEWAQDGISGKLFIVQARPETVQSQKNTTTLQKYHLLEKGKVLTSGRAVGEKIATGHVRIIRKAADLNELRDGEVVVTDKTDPDWEPAMKKATAIITDRGGRTCHAAIVSRELGLPAIIGTHTGTADLQNGLEVTVSCNEGDTGYVYESALKFTCDEIDLSKISQVRPKTKVMMNLANPDIAFSMAQLPSDGVGLARMEFIINHAIKIHPMALLNFDTMPEDETKQHIADMTRHYRDKANYFVDRLAEGIAMIAAAFYPKDVILRFSDFKSNEYAGLLGGKQFEPMEDNPMIGFRGAARYYSEEYRDGFALECRAVKKVRETMGLNNLKLMIPFCRTLEEGEKVLREMAKNGLERGINQLEVYVMCEIPSNVILADKFADYFDGFSIGSNDLTQLTLGVDRDSERLSELFDERNPAVKAMISMVIDKAKARDRKIGICGQGPSDYPEFAEWLVSQEIDSMSLNPDSIVKTTQRILKMENTV